MKLIRSTFIFSTLVILIVSCRTTKNADKIAEKSIGFGSGGGFTGQVIEYVIDGNGIFLKNDKLKSEISVLPNLKPSETRKLFKQLQTMQFDTIHFNHPGNMYYYIRLTESNNTHEVIWGDPNHSPPGKVLQFYQLLISKTI